MPFYTIHTALRMNCNNTQNFMKIYYLKQITWLAIHGLTLCTNWNLKEHFFHHLIWDGMRHRRRLVLLQQPSKRFGFDKISP